MKIKNLCKKGSWVLLLLKKVEGKWVSYINDKLKRYRQWVSFNNAKENLGS